MKKEISIVFSTALMTLTSFSLPFSANCITIKGNFEGYASGGETVQRDVGNGIVQTTFISYAVNLNGNFTFDTDVSFTDGDGISRFPLKSIDVKNTSTGEQFTGTGFAFLQGIKEDLFEGLNPDPDFSGRITLPRSRKFLGIDAIFFNSAPLRVIQFTHTGNVAPSQGGFNTQYSFISRSSGQLLTLPGQGIATVSAVPVPDPSSALCLLAFGALGAGSLLKRKQKQKSVSSATSDV